MNASRSKHYHCDPVLAITVGLLTLIGVVMVFSSSAVYAMEEYNDSYYFLKRQLLFVLIGGGILLCAKKLDYRKLQKLTYPAMAVTFILLVLVMIPGIGKEVGGARRWLSIGGFTFQPSELAKFTLVLFIAKSLVKRADKLKNFAYGYLPNLIVLGLFFLPILFQPDFGTAMIICVVTLTMLFIAGIRTKFLIYSGLAVIPLLVSAVMSAEYRMRRILAFLDPWQDPSDSGFQAIQSFYAFGRGGPVGSGIGRQHAETVLPAGSPHGFHFFGHRRGIGVCRRQRHCGPFWNSDLAGFRNGFPGEGSLRHASRDRNHVTGQRAGGYQHGSGGGASSNQGIDAPVHQHGGVFPGRVDALHGSSAQYLGKTRDPEKLIRLVGYV